MERKRRVPATTRQRSKGEEGGGRREREIDSRRSWLIDFFAVTNRLVSAGSINSTKRDREIAKATTCDASCNLCSAHRSIGVYRDA